MSTRTELPVSARPRWEMGTEPGRLVVALGVAAALSVAVLDIALGGHVSFFFDLCFVVLSLGLAVLVREGDFFMVGILPPLLMLAVVVLTALSARGAIAHPDDGFGQAVITGLAVHSGALVAGYALALGILALRSRGLSDVVGDESSD